MNPIEARERKSEPLSAYIQRVWVARDNYDRAEKRYALSHVQSLEAEVERYRRALEEIVYHAPRFTFVEKIARAALDTTTEGGNDAQAQ